jgi:superoxide reductase
MEQIFEMFQKADWKKEKHVPVIELPDTITKDESIQIKVSIGKEIPHPNTTEHHIDWIELYFHPAGEKFPYRIGKIEFASHGASIDGPNTSMMYTRPEGTMCFQTEKPGKIIAFSYCNIHGLWTNEKEVPI